MAYRSAGQLGNNINIAWVKKGYQFCLSSSFGECAIIDSSMYVGPRRLSGL